MSTPSTRFALVLAGVGVIATSGLTACSSKHQATPNAAAVSDATAKPKGTTIQFVAKEEAGNMAMADLGAKSAPGGLDIGDVMAFTQALTRDGKPVGQAHVVSVGVDHTRRLSESSGTLSLSDGTIQVAGIVAMAPTFTLTVVGGTGAYAGQTGTLDFDGSGDTQKMTVHLTGRLSQA